MQLETKLTMNDVDDEDDDVEGTGIIDLLIRLGYATVWIFEVAYEEI